MGKEVDPTCSDFALALRVVEEHAVRRQKLIEKVEVSDIPRQDGPAAFKRLKVEAGVVQQERALGSLNAKRRAANPASIPASPIAVSDGEEIRWAGISSIV